MFDRDRYWVDRIVSLICASPGITLTQLRERTRKLTTQERQRYLDQLAATNRIRWCEIEGASGGPMSCGFWPATEGQANTLAVALDDVRRQLAAALAQLNAVMAMVTQTDAATVPTAMPA